MIRRHNSNRSHFQRPTCSFATETELHSRLRKLLSLKHTSVALSRMQRTLSLHGHADPLPRLPPTATVADIAPGRAGVRWVGGLLRAVTAADAAALVAALAPAGGATVAASTGTLQARPGSADSAVSATRALAASVTSSFLSLSWHQPPRGPQQVLASANSSTGRRQARRGRASATALDVSTHVAAGGTSPASFEMARALTASAALSVLAHHQHRRLQRRPTAPPARFQSEAQEEALTSSPDSDDQSSLGPRGLKCLRLATPVDDSAFRDVAAGAMSASALRVSSAPAAVAPSMLSSITASAAVLQTRFFVPIGRDELAETIDTESNARGLLAAQPWGYGGAAFPSVTPLPAPFQSPPVHQLQWLPRPESRWGVVNENDSGAYPC